MISQNPYSNCMSARLYYYDFLNEESKEGIPESILNHIDTCLDCQAEINRLDSLLAKADNRHEDQEGRRNSAITTLLKFHFSFVDEPVTCSTVKPFLASLADPVLQLLIPTPITEHIDKCQSCHTDLLALRDLHLTHKQLCRLGQLLAQIPTGDTQSCTQAREAIPAVASMVFHKANAEVLKHLSTCSDCREKLFQYREGLHRTLPNSAIDQDNIPCKAVLPSDIYDYAFPYGIDPADDEYAEFREPLASHLGECPTCLAKVQELQKKIYSIVERSESDVVTVYHVDDLSADHARTRAPIPFAARMRKGLSSPRVRSWLRASAAAAAVVIIGLVFMFNEPTVEADLWDQMSRAIEKARNIHISTFIMDKTEPIQERWVSRSLGLYLFKDTDRFDMFDFTNEIQKVREIGSNTVAQNILSDNAQAKIERNVAVYLNLLPFARLSEAPKGTNWNRATNDNLAMADGSSEIYDLIWIDTSERGLPIFYKRQYYVDPETNLPHKIEFYQKFSERDEYELISKVTVEKVNDSDIQAAVENSFP